MSKKKKGRNPPTIVQQATALVKRAADSVMRDDDDAVGEPVSARETALEKRIAALEKTADKPRGGLVLSAPAKALLYDAKDAIARGLSSVDAHGQASVRFDLESEEEVEGAAELESKGYGRLYRTQSKTENPTCSVHGQPYPCALGQKQIGSGAPARSAGYHPDDGAPVCRFAHNAGEPTDWVFEYTGGGASGPGEGGILRGGVLDED